MEAHKKHWGVNQWAAFFETRRLPVMAHTKQRLCELEEQAGETLSPNKLATAALEDPFLCIQLLREAERVRTRRLGNETTTTLQAVMQLGVDHVKKLLLDSEEADSNQHNQHDQHDRRGLLYLQTRAALAAHIALRWSAGRADLNPAELALAALLSDTGELLLWLYAPELTQAALDELHSGRATRTTQAQIQACGFTFKELTNRCAELWSLPSLLRKLLQGAESERALLTRTCTDFARHLLNPDANSDKALAADIVSARKLMPNVSYAWLLSEIDITLLDEERKQRLIERADNLLTFEI